MNDNDLQALKDALTTINKLVVENDLEVDCLIDTKNKPSYMQIGVLVNRESRVAVQLPLQRAQVDRKVYLLKPLVLPELATVEG